MELRKNIRTDIAASAIAHLTLVGLIILISEVHPFHAASPETVVGRHRHAGAGEAGGGQGRGEGERSVKEERRRSRCPTCNCRSWISPTRKRRPSHQSPRPSSRPRQSSPSRRRRPSRSRKPQPPLAARPSSARPMCSLSNPNRSLSSSASQAAAPTATATKSQPPPQASHSRSRLSNRRCRSRRRHHPGLSGAGARRRPSSMVSCWVCRPNCLTGRKTRPRTTAATPRIPSRQASTQDHRRASPALEELRNCRPGSTRPTMSTSSCARCRDRRHAGPRADPDRSPAFGEGRGPREVRDERTPGLPALQDAAGQSVRGMEGLGPAVHAAGLRWVNRYGRPTTQNPSAVTVLDCFAALAMTTWSAMPINDRASAPHHHPPRPAPSRAARSRRTAGATSRSPRRLW